MKPIQMVDLITQYSKIKPEVEKAFEGVMNSAAFINGPEVQAFKSELQDYLNVKHVIPCANGTDALQVAMMGLGLKPGDEVIVPTFTYVATAEVIALLQLTPVLVDVDTDTFMLDPKAVEAAITSKTKAIVPVHLFGQCADMDAVMAIAEKHNLFVVEDTAQAIGSDYTFANGKTQKAGTIGNIGATSFFPSKPLGCYSDGGAIFTNNDGLAEKISESESAEYFATRPWSSQIGAWASAQSAPLSSREELEQRFAGASQKWPEGATVPMPPHWGGYRVTPISIEFWQGRYSRLHDRLRYERANTEAKWEITRYYP